MIRLTIDGQDITVPEGTLVVEAAKRLGIEVPVYCYHEALGPLGACRICLVEIEKMPKLATACTTTVTEGMVVHTQGPAVEKGRKGILEFLLINHPLDCPVCDKGGECFLQDYAFYYGPGKNRFEEAKIQRQKDYPVNSYILLDQERCVLCQRCVRFMSEYVGETELKLDGRGVHTVVARVEDAPVTSPFAGNVIDLCPVGALLSEPYHFKARPWNIEREESVCTRCPVGCPSYITGRDGRLVRMEGRPTDDNPGWLCDHGRFGYDFGYHPARLTASWLDGQPARMSDVARRVGERLRATVTEQGGDAVAVLVGGIHTVEDEYAVARFAREVLGTERVAFLPSVRGQVPSGLLGTFADLEQADTVLLVGTDPYEAVPVVHLKLRQAVLQHGQRLWAVGERRVLRPSLPGRELVAAPGHVAAALARALAAASEEAPAQTVVAAVLDVETGIAEAGLDELGHALLAAETLAVLWDGQDPGVAEVLAALSALRSDRPTRVLPTYGPASAWSARRAGMATDYATARGILEDAAAGRIQSLMLWGADPVRDFPDGDLAARALERCAEVYFAGWFPPMGADAMTALLPTAAWGEVTGTYVNMEGRLTVARQAANAPGEARPVRLWLNALARGFGRTWRFPEDWDPFSEQDGDLLAREAAVPEAGPVERPAAREDDGFAVITGPSAALGPWPSEILARTREAYPARLNPSDMARLNLSATGDRVVVKSGDRRFEVGVRADALVPPGRLFVPRGLDALPWNRLATERVTLEPRREVTVS
jgi:NADH-quinone oxidoreductase subunit G